MKKAIFAIAALAILTAGNGFAQKGYSSKGTYQSQGHDGPVYKNNARIDSKVEEYNISKLDNIVALTRNQENEIKKIESYYDRIVRSSKKAQTFESIKRLELQKQQDILEVLTSYQRQKLVAYENAQRYNNGRDNFNNNNKYNNRRG